jgi:hypothetical protein
VGRTRALKREHVVMQVLRCLTATLSSEAAPSLNQAARKQIVKPAETVGDLTVVVPATPPAP